MSQHNWLCGLCCSSSYSSDRLFVDDDDDDGEKDLGTSGLGIGDVLCCCYCCWYYISPLFVSLPYSTTGSAIKKESDSTRLDSTRLDSTRLDSTT